MTSKARRMEEFLPVTFITFLFCLSMIPSISLAWTSRKCMVYEEQIFLRSEDQCFSFYAFPNRTLAAGCDNVSNLQEDLSDIPGETLALCVCGSVQVIHTNAFARFQQLVHLSINFPVYKILPGAFHGLPNLQNLSIDYFPTAIRCKNISLAFDVFHSLPSLRSLALTKFCASHIESVVLPPFIQLLELSLKFDGFEDIREVFTVFRGIQSIHRLDLSNNYIEIVDGNFSQLGSPEFEQWGTAPNISELDLTGNIIKTVNPNAFSGFNLCSLILSPISLPLEDLLHSGLVKLDHLSVSYVMEEQYDSIYTCFSIAEKFSLKSLAITKNNIPSISSDALCDCRFLETLDLSLNKLNYLDNFVLYRMPQLSFLDLSANILSLDLCPPSYEDIGFSSGLKVLLLSSNKIRFIKDKLFSCMPHLLKLDLSENHIQTIESGGFLGLTKLKSLNLRSNILKTLGGLQLTGIPNLISLDVQMYGIGDFAGYEFGEQKFLTDLKLQTKYMFFIPEYLPRLKNLFFSAEGSIGIQTENDSAMSSLQSLTFEASHISLESCNLLLFHNVRELYFYYNENISFCKSPMLFYEVFPLLEKMIYVHRPAGHFYKSLNFSNLYHLKTLVVHNMFSAMEDPSANPEYIFKNLPHLIALMLVNSGIKYFTSGMFKSMILLQVLLIDGNAIVSLENDMQASVYHLSYLYLFQVTLQCDCANSWVIPWAVRGKRTFVANLINVNCLNYYIKYNFVTFVEESCNKDIAYSLFLVTSMLILLFIYTALLYNTCKSFFLNLIYILKAWLRRLRGRREHHGKYDYDAFVSYCSLDQDWILHHLIPNLEKGPPFLKLCLHNRDFEVGKDIVDNIADSIYRSRKTICVISHNYLRSGWCSLEMRMATYRLLAEHEDVLILVFLEHISRYQLSSYHRLAKIVKKKTYIDWPEEGDEQMAFWDRLRRSLENTYDKEIDVAMS